MLSKVERAFLEGKLKPKEGYCHDLHHSIRRKIPRAMRDLTLIFEKILDPEEKDWLRFTRKDHFDYAIPLIRALQGYELERTFYDGIKETYLAMALEEARKRYDYKRLVLDEDYRDHLIRWLRKYERRTGHKVWQPPKTEEQKRRFEKFKRMMGEPEVIEQNV